MWMEKPLVYREVLDEGSKMQEQGLEINDALGASENPTEASIRVVFRLDFWSLYFGP